jgi:hypothetical protein
LEPRRQLRIAADGARHAVRSIAALLGLAVALGADALAAEQPRTDALVPGTRFHATGEIPCAQAAGQPMRPCRFGVVRQGLGRAEVTVFRPDGSVRTIVFEGARPVRFGGAAPTAGAAMTVDQDRDLFTVRIGTERYEIPEAVVSGG